MRVRIAVKKMAGNHAKVFETGKGKKKVFDRDVIYFIGKIVGAKTLEYLGREGTIEIHDSGKEVKFFVDHKQVKLRIKKPLMTFDFKSKEVVVDDF